MLLWLIFRLYLPWVILSTNKKNSSLFVVPSRGLMMVSQPMTGWRTEIGYRGTIRLDAFMTFACTLPCPMSRDENGVVSKSEPPFHHSVIPSFNHSIIPSFHPMAYHHVPLQSMFKLPFSPLWNTPKVAINWGQKGPPLWDPAQSARTRSLPGIAVTRRRSGAANCQRRLVQVLGWAKHDPSGTHVAHTLNNYKLYIIYKQILNTLIVYIYIHG